VLDATRGLLRVRDPSDARRLAEEVVRALGGELVPADRDDRDVIPADVSFGAGAPALPAAPPGSIARALLERHLPAFLHDARRALELAGRTERLLEDASIDPLTGLPNRRMVGRALGRLTAQDAVILIDLDHFKAVNDDHGHAAGDQVLRAFGQTLQATARGRDTVGRLGGEEFVVILAPAAGAEEFLQRLRATWAAERPRPVTFSAGVARATGDAEDTLALADVALYRAKSGGRDRWLWAEPTEPAELHAADFVTHYLDKAVRGERRTAIRVALDLLDSGVPHGQVVSDLLAAAQREVGERWYRNELTVADEHIASGVAAASLHALESEARLPPRAGHTVVVCAEGDWHALAAQMLGDSLRALGVGVSVLGASTPASTVAEVLVRGDADSLAVSCSIAIHLPGVARLVDAAHAQGIPVVVGGRAFAENPARAERLGADACALTASEAAPILAGWRADPPTVSRAPHPLDHAALQLCGRAAELGSAALDALAARFPAMAAYDERELAHTEADLGYIVQFLGAALLVHDDTVFTGFLDWHQTLLVSRGVPPHALLAGLDALRPVVEPVSPAGALLLDRGHRWLTDRQDATE
jgi:diguanylate cyclase (GGDEF)-like protein